MYQESAINAAKTRLNYYISQFHLYYKTFVMLVNQNSTLLNHFTNNHLISTAKSNHSTLDNENAEKIDIDVLKIAEKMRLAIDKSQSIFVEFVEWKNEIESRLGIEFSDQVILNSLSLNHAQTKLQSYLIGILKN
jgi:hypothetical protein